MPLALTVKSALGVALGPTSVRQAAWALNARHVSASADKRAQTEAFLVVTCINCIEKSVE